MATLKDVLARIEEESRDQLDFCGFARKDPTKEALAAIARERQARRGHAPAEGLFDDTARAQIELF